jgi:hypothetical protein
MMVAGKVASKPLNKEKEARLVSSTSVFSSAQAMSPLFVFSHLVGSIHQHHRDTLLRWRRYLIRVTLFRVAYRRRWMSGASMTRLKHLIPCTSIPAVMPHHQFIPLEFRRALPLDIPQLLYRTKARSSPLRSWTLSNASLQLVWYTRPRAFGDGLRRTFGLLFIYQ